MRDSHLGCVFGQEHAHVVEKVLQRALPLLQGWLGREHKVHLLVPGLHGKHQAQLGCREGLVEDLPAHGNPCDASFDHSQH